MYMYIYFFYEISKFDNTYLFTLHEHYECDYHCKYAGDAI